MNLRVIALTVTAVLLPTIGTPAVADDQAQNGSSNIEQLRDQLQLDEPLSRASFASCEEAVRQLFSVESIVKRYGEASDDPFARPYTFAPLKCSVAYDDNRDPLAIVATPRPGLKRLPKPARDSATLPVYAKKRAQVLVSNDERMRIKANSLRKIDGVPVWFESTPSSMEAAQAFLDVTAQINTRDVRVPRGWRKHIGKYRSVSLLRGSDTLYTFSTPEEVFLEGIIRANGDIIIPPIYDQVELIDGGFIARTEDGLDGLFSLDGKPTLPVEYNSIVHKGEGRLSVYDSEERYQVYDTASRAFLGERYEDLDFIEDANLIVVENGGVHRFLTRDMTPAFGESYSRVMRLSGNKFIVKAGDAESLIDQDGNALIPARFDSLWPHGKHRLIYATAGKETAYFDYDGQQISPEGWNVHYAPSVEKAYITVSDKDGRFGVIDSSGKFVIPAEYSQIHQFREGYLPAAKPVDGWSQKGQRFGLLDEAGRTIIPFAYENLQLVRKGRLWARKDGKWGLIDTGQTVIADFTLDQISRFREVRDPETREDLPLMIAKKDGLYGMVRHDTGELVVPFAYAEARPLALQLRKSGEWVTYPCVVKPELDRCKSNQTPGAVVIPSSRRPR